MKHSYHQRGAFTLVVMMASCILFWLSCGGGSSATSPAAAEPADEPTEITETATVEMTVGGTAVLPVAAAASVSTKTFGFSDIMMSVLDGETELASCAIASDGVFACDITDASLVPAAGTVLCLSARDTAGSGVLEARCTMTAEASTLDCGEVNAATTLSLWSLERAETVAAASIAPSLSSANQDQLYDALITIFGMELTDLSNVNPDMFAVDLFTIYQAYVAAVEAGSVDGSTIIANTDLDVLMSFLATNFEAIAEGADDVDGIMIALIGLEPDLLGTDGAEFFLQIIAETKAAGGDVPSTIMGIGGMIPLSLGMGLSSTASELFGQFSDTLRPKIIRGLSRCDDTCTLTANATFSDFETCIRGTRVLGMISFVMFGISMEDYEYDAVYADQMADIGDDVLLCTLQNCGDIDLAALFQGGQGISSISAPVGVNFSSSPGGGISDIVDSAGDIGALVPVACAACFDACMEINPDGEDECGTLWIYGMMEVTDWIIIDYLGQQEYSEGGDDDDDDGIANLSGNWGARTGENNTSWSECGVSNTPSSDTYPLPTYLGTEIVVVHNETGNGTLAMTAGGTNIWADTFMSNDVMELYPIQDNDSKPLASEPNDGQDPTYDSRHIIACGDGDDACSTLNLGIGEKGCRLEVVVDNDTPFLKIGCEVDVGSGTENCVKYLEQSSS